MRRDASVGFLVSASVLVGGVVVPVAVVLSLMAIIGFTVGFIGISLGFTLEALDPILSSLHFSRLVIIPLGYWLGAMWIASALRKRYTIQNPSKVAIVSSVITGVVAGIYALPVIGNPEMYNVVFVVAVIIGTIVFYRSSKQHLSS